MSGPAVLLLGGGFIGTALARHLAAQGKSVHVVTRRPANADFSTAHVHRGSLEDRDLLAKLLPECGTVIHLAAETTPGNSARQPAMEAANLLPTLALLDLLQDYPAHHLIYFSSGGTLYGNPDRLPVAESAPFSPLSYHGAGKAAQEMFLQVLRAQGRAVTILRPANAYGPGQSLRAGFGLVRTVLESIRHDQPLKVWGDGESVRDYVYVDDVVAACALCVERPDDNGTYNVGSGVGLSINELIRRAGEICGQLPQIDYRPARTGDVAKVVLDIARMRALGWSPEVNIDEGLRRTWEWLRNHP